LNPPVDPYARKRLPSTDFLSSDILVSKFAFSNSTCTATLRYRVKSDGRKYIVSLRTDNWITVGLCRLNQVDP
jgi:hypothetical protein